MATIEFFLLDAPSDPGVYNCAKTITGESTMQLRKRVGTETPLVIFDTDDFPLTTERSEYYDEIRAWVSKLTATDCEFQLLYRISSEDDPEQISVEQLNNLLTSDIDYEKQERD